MKKTVDLARRSARVDTTVLITGPSGAGKERVARLIHAESPRAAGPFIAVNCAALTETLLESELFGHAKGAFTGATSDRVGLFEAANNGTLLLDEIGEVSPRACRRSRCACCRSTRFAGSASRATGKVDVRVLAATNRTLADEVARGAFRHDLYYRLRVIELRVPALRERRCDIVPLTRLFLAEAAERLAPPRRRDLTRRRCRPAARATTGPATCASWRTPAERAVALAIDTRRHR